MSTNPPPNKTNKPNINVVIERPDIKALDQATEASLFVDKRNDLIEALEANKGWIKNKIARQVGEQAAVDEVFQDVALAVTKQKQPLRDPSKVGAWLNRLVIIQSALYRRTLGRKRKLLKVIEEHNSSSQDYGQLEQSPLNWLLAKERNECVRKALAELSSQEQRILLMKYAEDKSYQEIANEFQITVSAVQSKLHRARIRLKKLLHDFMYIS